MTAVWTVCLAVCLCVLLLFGCVAMQTVDEEGEEGDEEEDEVADVVVAEISISDRSKPTNLASPFIHSR